MEGKMNSAVEKLLSRPNVIACSELEQRDTNAERKTKPTIGVSNGCNEINVGAETNNMMNADDATSDSCCSILLGYVDDQSRQVRKDLEQWSTDREQNGEKQQRLKILLKRLDELRMSLIQELKNDQKGKAGERVKVSSNKEGKYQQLIEDISTYRKERENILSDEVHQKQNIKSKDQISAKELRDRKIEKFNSKVSSKHPLDEREKILHQKEAILDEKLREFYELQKQNKTKKISKRKENVSETHTEIQQETEYSDNKENIDCSTIQTPLEIVITVQGETKCIKIPGSSKRKPMQKRSHTQLATLIRSPQTKAKITKATPKKKLPIPRDKESPAKSQIPTQGKGNQVNKPMLGRHNSYDSNSTSYMSLPPQMPTQLGVLVDKQQQHEETIHKSTSSEDTQVSTDLDNDESQEHQIKKPVPHLNPLVAQYVQRLLGMSRKAIQRLGVSSSDIDTPNSTIINTSGNHSTSESILSDERLAFVESFVQENRSFIKELEKSIRTQNNESLENSMRAFDEIWRKQLKKQQKSSVEKPKEKLNKQQTKVKKSQETNAILSKDIVPNTETKELQSKEVTSQPKLSSEFEKPSTSKLTTRTTLSAKCKKAQDKHKEPQCGQEEITNVKSCQNTLGQRRSSEKVDKAVETKMSQDLNKSESDSQIARYAQLTENCTHRIAELTELINRVREEKQRLLEVTLSSVSDNGRQSTEYLDLPEGKSRTTNEGESSLASSTEETTAAPHKSTSSLDIGRQIPKLSALEKNRSIAASQDSGIAESRPMTALEHRQDLEPISQTTTESHSIVQGHRKMKPPPSLRRFSPQFQEDELVHELSTILEVDTPANSRINTAVSQKSEDPTTSVTPPQNPIMFPTFEEYVQRLNLDISQMDKEQSSQLHAEFSLFIEDMQRSRTKEQGK